MAEDQNLNAIVRSLLGLTGSQQPMETNALIRELARRMVLSGLSFDESTGAVEGLSGSGFTDLNADELTSGTVPDARFPATLPAVSGENLTDLNADELSSGTVPDARFPATLPAISGADLTNLDADDLASGTIPDARFPATLPAISGANLTNLDASDLATGTVPDARFPATLPAASGANLTNLNASNLASGTVADARLATTAWTDYSGTSTITGWSSLTTTKIFYKKIGKSIFVAFQLEGTSNATTVSFTLPVARSTDAGFAITFALAGDLQDSGSAVETGAFGQLGSGSSTVTMVKSSASAAWTASGTKRVAGQFWYEGAS